MGLILGGCVYDAPFVEEAVLPVDQALVGVWEEIPEAGQVPDPDEHLVILPFNAHEYVAVISNELYFRAYPVCIGAEQFVQVEWLGAQEDRYQLCKYTLQDGILTVETVNDEVVGSEIKTSEALRSALIANRARPELFTDPVCYQRSKD